VRDGQTSPHRPRFVVSRSTCPALSPSPHANSFIIGTAVINTTNWILPAHTHRFLPPRLPCLASHFRQGRVANVPPASHPPINGLPIPKSFPPTPLRSGRSPCCITSLRLVPGLPETPSSFLAPKCQCQPLRQNANVNLFAKMPMSTYSQNANVNPFTKMHHPQAPHSFSVLFSPCRTHSKLSNPWNTSSAVPPRF
jgi:hypothetical protein